MNTANALIGGMLAATACLAPLTPQATPPAQAMTVAWQQDIAIEGRPFIAAGGHAIVAAGSESGLSAYAPEDGHALWQRQALTDSEPVAVGRVVVLVADGGLLAIDQATGKDVWKAALDGAEPLNSLSLRATDTLVFAVRGTDLRAWREDGAVAWQRTLPSQLVTQIVTSGNVLIAGLEQSEILAIDAATGATRWTARLDTAPTALAIADGRLFVPTAGGELLAFRVTAGGLKTMWKYRDRAITAVGPPAVNARLVFYALMDNTLKAFHRNSGSRVWTASLASRPVTGPVLLGDDVAVPLASGELAQLPAASGKARAKPADPSVSPVRLRASAFSGGRLYAVVTAGNQTTTLRAWGPAR